MSGEDALRAVEHFRPRLRTSIERFALSNGGVALYGGDRYLVVDAVDAPLLAHLDGEQSLTEIVEATAAAGAIVSIRRLLALVGDLAALDLLENPGPEMRTHGLAVKTRPRRSWLRRLTPAIASRAFGRAGTAVLRPLAKIVPSSRVVAGFASAGGLIVLALLSFGHAPAKLGSDALMLGGSHVAGFVMIYTGVVLGLAGRELTRALVTASLGPIEAVGVRFWGIFVAPYADGRHVFRAGAAGEMRLALGGIAGALSTLLSLLLVMGFTGEAGAHAFGLAAIGAGAVVYVACCPFLPTDLGRVIDLGLPTGDGRRHALSFFERRLLRGQGAHPMFENEHHHMLVAIATILWVYGGFMLSTRWLKSQLWPAIHTLLESDSVLDRVLVTLIAVTAALVLLTSAILALAGLVRFAIAHIPRRHHGRVLPEDSAGATAALGSLPLFSHLAPATLNQIAARARAMAFTRGQDVVRQDGPGEDFYVIAAGDALVLRHAPSGLEREVATLHVGDGFGEIALLENRPRTATVRATSELRLFALGRADFLAALEQAGVKPEAATARLRGAHAIANSEVFGHLAPSSIAKMLTACARSEHEPGSVIIRAGEVSDRFFVIESGHVRVERDGREVATFGPGDCFGELEIFTAAPRAATVTCTAPSVLLSLGKERFRDIIAHDFAAGVRLERIAKERA